MIPITPEIIGPGIDEEYADALAAIQDLRIALGEHHLTNHTPEGRILMEIKWLEQEIETKRLPIPVDSSYVGTVLYLTGSNELANYPGFQAAIGQLWLVVKGYGLIKVRHTPLIISMIDDVLIDIKQVRPPPFGRDLEVLDGLQENRCELVSGSWPKVRIPQKMYSTLVTESFAERMGNGVNRLRAIDLPLFDGWRPRPARKPTLPAPVSGLPERAPPLPPELEGALP